jgi:glutathione S-transferase
VLETRLGGRAFFAGDKLSIADITVACVLMQISLVAETPLERWSGLAAHFAAMRARACIAGPYAAAETIIRKALPTRFDLT